MYSVSTSFILRAKNTIFGRKMSQCVQAAVRNLQYFRRNCATQWFLLTNQVARIFFLMHSCGNPDFWAPEWHQVHLRMVQNDILDKDLKLWSDFGKTANTLMIIVAEWSQGFIGPFWVLSNDFESPDRSLHLHSTKKEDIWVELWASATEPIDNRHLTVFSENCEYVILTPGFWLVFGT